MWIRSNVNTDSYNGLFTKYGGSAGWDLILSSGKVRMALRGTSEIDTGGGSGSDLRDGNWHHIVAVNTNSDIKLYLDAVLIKTQTGTWTPTTTTNDALIGQRAGIPNFDGTIDEVGIFNTALSSDQVIELYNQGVPSNLSTHSANANLAGYWKMGDGTLDEAPLIADQTNATLGSELVVNGNFATDSDWTAGSNWTIANNLATSDGSQTGNVSLKQSNSVNNFVTGKIYKVEFTISNYVAGVINPHIRGQASGNVSGNGLKTAYITAGSSSDGINLVCWFNFCRFYI
ncbi:MAG: hypothetical protein CM15mV105_290 [uncultured marine virus]|nr:MAG: hypothetical protein CM15mV105_290 [uncultured marine virus]